MLWINQFRLAIVLVFGFCSGLPLGLVGGTLQAWLVSRQVDLSWVGAFSLVSLPYSLKFLWAPFMDRYPAPFFGHFLGRRRGWIFCCQLLLASCLITLGQSDPVHHPLLFSLLALLVAFFSASQDIVIDAYRAEILKPHELGLGAAQSILGYRLAMLFSGAFALILSDFLSWPQVYAVMGLTLVFGMAVTLCVAEPDSGVKPPVTLAEAVVKPFADFFQRKKVFSLLCFLIFYKLDVVVALAMLTPFLMQLGFTRTDIGAVTKGFGLWATIVGSFAGGWGLKYLGMKRALWVFGLLQGISGFSFVLLAHLGKNYPALMGAVVTENFLSGMGNAAYTAFLMSLCRAEFTATQFALLSSLMAVTRTVAGVPTGWLVQQVGWESYFLISIALMLPGLLWLTQFDAWNQKKYEAGS